MSAPPGEMEMSLEAGRDGAPPPPPEMPHLSALETESPQTAVSFANSGNSHATGSPGSTPDSPGRKIHRKDVQNIFHASTTKGTISFEQVKRIKAMHDKIDEGIEFNFNYYCLLMVASAVAALGLATDSSTTVISSMLLSPIMGPVIGMSYGLCIWDLPMIKRSARNEIVSITICVIFGVIIGACCSWTQMADDWPTNEMLSRGTRTTFLAGIPIAFFSGLGVALSVLDDQTSSLVGVAISASLLPPAVNCGMLLIVAAIKGDDWSAFNFDYGEDRLAQIEQAIEEASNVKYDFTRSFSQAGITSLLLTIANVIMVALGAALMFRAKEVLPVKKKIFWDDLKIARRIYQGRAIDSITGEPLTIEQITRMVRQYENLENMQGGIQVSVQ